MENKVVKFEKKGKFNRNHRKENNFYQEYLVIDNDTKSQIIACRFYRTSARCYCCLWIWTKELSLSGTDWTDGGGYHMASAAFDLAANNAGYVFEHNISGVGDTAIESGLMAICSFHGLNNCSIYNAHA